MIATPSLIPRSPLFWLVVAFGLTWTIHLGSSSPGTPLHDEITHYLIARDAWRDPVVALDVWGRPGNTVFYMLPSLVSLGARRWWAVAALVVIALLTTRTAARLGMRRLALIPLMLWLQPWYAQLGFTSITQIPFMLFLTLGIDRWAAGKHGWASLCFGLLPITRHEGLALTVLWIGFLMLQRRWHALLPALIPMAAWNGLYYLVYGRLASGNLVDLVPTDIYGSGNWLHFAGPSIANIGLPVLLLAAVGLIELVRQRSGWVYALPTACYFIVHTIIYRFGLFASGGYIFFLLPIAPTVALLAACGAERLLSAAAAHAAADERQRLMRGAAVLFLGAALVWNGAAAALVRPWRLQPNEIAAQQAADWLRAHGETATPVYSTHVWFFWIYDEPGLRRIPGGGAHLDPADIPSSAYYLWDRNYGDLNGIPLAELRAPDSGFTEVQRFEADEMILFKRSGGG
jgi:hypothetical protein